MHRKSGSSRAEPCNNLAALGRLEGNALKLDLLMSDRATPSPRGPRVTPGAREILERGQQGVGSVLLQFGGISLGPEASPKSKLWAKRAVRGD